jgi:Amt family ammonium transporter
LICGAGALGTSLFAATAAFAQEAAAVAAEAAAAATAAAPEPVAAAAEAAAATVNKGDTAWMMTSTVLVHGMMIRARAGAVLRRS